MTGTDIQGKLSRVELSWKKLSLNYYLVASTPRYPNKSTVAQLNPALEMELIA